MSIKLKFCEKLLVFSSKCVGEYQLISLNSQYHYLSARINRSFVSLFLITFFHYLKQVVSATFSTQTKRRRISARMCPVRLYPL